MPETLKPLVDRLAALPQDERELVIAIARRAANDASATLKTISWQHLRDAVGSVHLGGDALRDSEALYDDA